MRYWGMPQFAYVTRTDGVVSPRFAGLLLEVWGVSRQVITASERCERLNGAPVTGFWIYFGYVARVCLPIGYWRMIKLLIYLASPTGFEPVLSP